MLNHCEIKPQQHVSNNVFDSYKSWSDVDELYLYYLLNVLI